MTVTHPTPHVLDKKRKTGTNPDVDVNADNPGHDTTKPAVDDTTPMIVHHVRFTDDNGVQRDKYFGPMPVADYAAWLADFEAGKVTK